MLTKSHTLHGYEKINFPEGRYRTSIAAYAYSIDDGSTNTPYKSTQWAPKGFIKKKLASISNFLVPLKQKFFGSRAAKQAKKN